MGHGIDLTDRNAWDDSLLVNSWNDVVKEYEKYHSIHKSGKRLEDVLSEEELKELRKDYREVIAEEAPTSGSVEETTTGADQEDAEMTPVESNGNEDVDEDFDEAEAEQWETKISEQQQPASTAAPTGHDAALASSMPEAILGTVQDENLKNIMMAWYYAGYYTGLHAGQQQAPKNNP